MQYKKTDKNLKEFETLVNKHHKLILGFAMSLINDIHTAKDIAQNALLTAFLKLDNFDRKRDFGKWVRGIVKIKYLEYNRQNRNVFMEDDLIDLIAAQYNAWSENEEKNKQSIYINLKECINKLDEASITIINKFYFEKFKCAKIAQQCDLNESTVRKRLERIRKNLKTCIKNGGVNNE